MGCCSSMAATVACLYRYYQYRYTETISFGILNLVDSVKLQCSVYTDTTSIGIPKLIVSVYRIQQIRYGLELDKFSDITVSPAWGNFVPKFYPSQSHRIQMRLVYSNLVLFHIVVNYIYYYYCIVGVYIQGVRRANPAANPPHFRYLEFILYFLLFLLIPYKHKTQY